MKPSIITQYPWDRGGGVSGRVRSMPRGDKRQKGVYVAGVFERFGTYYSVNTAYTVRVPRPPGGQLLLMCYTFPEDNNYWSNHPAIDSPVSNGYFGDTIRHFADAGCTVGIKEWEVADRAESHDVSFTTAANNTGAYITWVWLGARRGRPRLMSSAQGNSTPPSLNANGERCLFLLVGEHDTGGTVGETPSGLVRLVRSGPRSVLAWPNRIADSVSVGDSTYAVKKVAAAYYDYEDED